MSIQKSNAAPPHFEHFPVLDFMRAFAALLVLLGHTRNWYLLNIGAVDKPGLFLKVFWFVTVLEHEAVVIFFVLSGFLVGGAVARSMENGSFDLKTYLIARFARIYLVYAPALVLTALVFWLAPHLLRDFGPGTIRPLFEARDPAWGGFRGVLCHLAGLQGFACAAWTQNPPLWSLGYEWSLYLFAPLVLGIALAPGPLLVRAGFVILPLGASAVISTSIDTWAFWYFAWFLGVAAAKVYRTRRLSALIGIAGLVLAGAAVCVARLKLVDLHLTDTFIAVGLGIAIACRPIVTAKPIGSRFFEWAAGFSYSLYATHLPIVFLLIALFQNLGFPTGKTLPTMTAYALIAVTTAVPIAFAYVFSLFTERQTDRVRRRFKAILSDRPAPSEPPALAPPETATA
jgi:peptidoglycan/LPS O-acetylase OafA/YrhL